jgi:regulator of replication initiation timing
MLRFLGIDKNLIRNPYQDDYIERLIQRLEKENEILRLENNKLREPKTSKPHDETLKPIRTYMSWAEQKARLEQADRILKSKEKEA